MRILVFITPSSARLLAVHKKPHGLLPRSKRSKRSCGGRINIICVCLCDTSRSDPLAPRTPDILGPLPLTWRLQFMGGPLKTSHAPAVRGCQPGLLYANRFPGIVFARLWGVGESRTGHEPGSDRFRFRFPHCGQDL